MRPALVYTYVDRARCYGEAGFERLRRHEPPRFRVLSHPHLGGRGGWSDIEFGASTHPDGRARKRLASMGRAWQREPVSRIFLKIALGWLQKGIKPCIMRVFNKITFHPLGGPDRSKALWTFNHTRFRPRKTNRLREAAWRRSPS